MHKCKRTKPCENSSNTVNVSRMQDKAIIYLLILSYVVTG